MHPVKAIAIGLLAWPAAEIVAFFIVAATIGFFNAIVLIALMSLAGAAVLRHFGSGRQQRVDTAGGFVSASAWSGDLAPGRGERERHHLHRELSARPERRHGLPRADQDDELARERRNHLLA